MKSDTYFNSDSKKPTSIDVKNASRNRLYFNVKCRFYNLQKHLLAIWIVFHKSKVDLILTITKINTDKKHIYTV